MKNVYNIYAAKPHGSKENSLYFAELFGTVLACTDDFSGGVGFDSALEELAEKVSEIVINGRVISRGSVDVIQTESACDSINQYPIDLVFVAKFVEFYKKARADVQGKE